MRIVPLADGALLAAATRCALRKLYLDRNGIGDDGCAALARAGGVDGP